MPLTRSCPLDPADDYQRLRADEPVRPVVLPDGRTGWLITRFEDARAVLADNRFSAYGAHSGPPSDSDAWHAPPPGLFIQMDPPEHTRYRRLVARYFTTRRVQDMRPRIERIVSDQLDVMQAHGSPVDLVPTFALPIPSLVICELLGVPYADLAEFQRKSETMLSVDQANLDEVAKARDELCRYIFELIGLRRRDAGDDLLSTLAAADGDGDALTDTELVSIGTLLLVAGHESSASMISLGALALLRNPAEIARATRGLAELSATVEELLRYLTIFHHGLTRIATADTELRGQRINAGDLVVVSLSAGNRDPARFAEPDRFTTERESVSNLAFGYGIHQCIGAQLARVELSAALGGLLRRFPSLRLAVPAEELSFREQAVVYGVSALPVAWD